MKIKTSISERVFKVANNVFMFFLMCIMFYPIWHVFAASISDNNALMAHRGVILKPLGLSFEAYRLMAKNPMILSGYMNTIFVVVVGVILNIIFTSIAAYFLSRKNVYWQKTVMIFIVITMFFSGGLIPSYLVNTKMLGLGNSYWALILPVLINTYNLIIMKTSFAGIPISLEESAKLDGAGPWTILFKIVLPLSKAVIAVMILYYGVNHWNSWFNANIYLTDRDKYPLQLVLREILISNDTSSMVGADANAADQQSIGETVKYAVIVVATFPILCIYPFVQKYFVKGVMVGAVKG